jgi:CubicO group peptidase (beta-lactamase class C family)
MKSLLKTGLVFLLCSITFMHAVYSQAWVARHNLSPAQYQAAFDEFTQQGYRLTTVSGYTCGGQERYIALWQKTAGPEWAARHGLSSQNYQIAFDDLVKKGYRLTHVSGYGVGSQAKFAGIWQKTSGAAWAAKHNMTAAQYQAAFNDFKNKGYRLLHVSGYVVNNTEYFAAIWDKSAGSAYIARHNLTSAQYQQAFNDYTKQGYYLKTVSGYTKSGTNLYAAIWEKISAPLWAARHGVGNGNYQYVFDNMYYQGYKPVYVNAYASGNSCEYNAIWTNTNMKGSDIAAIDEAVNQYMSSQGVKGLSLAICKDARLVFAKGYGYADPAAGEEMSPDQPMRIMSISKPVTSVGIMKLLEQNKLSSLDKTVFGPGSVLGSKYPTPAGKEKLNNITVRQLLNHTSGLRTCNGESVFWDKDKTADDAMNVLLGASDLITTDTGAQYIYSNTNYFILARVIEQLSGQSYETYIRNNVLNKSDIGATMYVGEASGNIKAGEGNYTPMTNMNLQLWAGFGGWVARPIDLLKFLNHVDGAATNPDIITSGTHTSMTTGSMRNNGYGCGWNVSGDIQNHNGCHGSSRSFLVELGGGISYAVIINSTPSNDGCGWTMKSAIEGGLNKVSGYPSYNLF